MKNQAIYQSNLVSESMFLVADKIQSLSFKQLLLVLRQWILATRPFVALAKFCSLVLEEEVSALKAINLLHAFVAFMAMLLLGGNSIIVQVLLMLWFAVTVSICKRNGWDKD